MQLEPADAKVRCHPIISQTCSIVDKTAMEVAKHLAEYVEYHGHYVGSHYPAGTVNCLSFVRMAVEKAEQCSCYKWNYSTFPPQIPKMSMAPLVKTEYNLGIFYSL